MNYLALTILALPLAIFTGCIRSQDRSSELFAVEKGLVQRSVEFSGRVRAKNRHLLRTPFNAQLVSINTQLGSGVSKGEVILSIKKPVDDDLLTELIDLKSRLDQTNIRIDQLKLEVKSSKKAVNRSAGLLKSGSIAASEHSQMSVGHQLKLKELKSLESERASLKQSLNLKEKSQRETKQSLTSPIKGTITQLWMDRGEMSEGISIPKDMVVAVIETKGDYVMDGTVIESDYLLLKVGMDAMTRLTHNTAQKWPGKILSISYAPEKDHFGRSHFQVQTLFRAQDGAIRSGLEAQSEVVIARKSDVLRVPRAAVWQSDTGYSVSLPGEGGSKIQRIEVGMIGDEFIEVRSGLGEGVSIYSAYVANNH